MKTKHPLLTLLRFTMAVCGGASAGTSTLAEDSPLCGPGSVK
ncbi:MAG: hypothetical protein ABL994_16645 [Verrucomicrobiales bacterium]